MKVRSTLVRVIDHVDPAPASTHVLPARAGNAIWLDSHEVSLLDRF
jgi:hypothetical protein